MRRTARQHNAGDFFRANLTSLALAAVDLQLLTEVTRLTVGSHIIDDAAAASFHRAQQNRPDYMPEPQGIPDSARRCSRVDADLEKCFVGVNISHARN